MRILYVTRIIPYPPNTGAAVRTYHLLRHLSRNHDVQVLSYSVEGGLRDPSGLEVFCDAVGLVPGDATLAPKDVVQKRKRQFASLFSTRSYQLASHYSRQMEGAIQQRVRETGVDLIVVEFSQMACFDFPADIPLVIDEHNVEFDALRRVAERSSWLSFRKWYNLVEAVKFKREELKFLTRANLVTVTSERDEVVLKSCVPGLCTSVVKNGVDTDYFRRPDVERKQNVAVFVGAMDYFPNEDGVLYFLREIFPLIRQKIPDFQVQIVGLNPPDSILRYRSDAVDVTGRVEDVRPYMWEGSVFVVPLNMGGGTRFKVVEAMAAKIPVVSTTLGAEGISVTHGREALLADIPEDFAEAVITVLKERDRAEQMAQAGHAFVRQHYEWKIIGGLLENSILKMTGA